MRSVPLCSHVLDLLLPHFLRFYDADARALPLRPQLCVDTRGAPSG